MELDEIIVKLGICEALPHIDNVWDKHVVGKSWDEQEYSLLEQVKEQTEAKIKEELSSRDFSNEFSQVTEIQKDIRSHASQIKGLNKAYGDAWLSSLCRNYGAEEVEAINEEGSLKDLLGQVIDKQTGLIKAIREKG